MGASARVWTAGVPGHAGWRPASARCEASARAQGGCREFSPGSEIRHGGGLVSALVICELRLLLLVSPWVRRAVCRIPAHRCCQGAEEDLAGQGAQNAFGAFKTAFKCDTFRYSKSSLKCIPSKGRVPGASGSGPYCIKHGLIGIIFEFLALEMQASVYGTEFSSVISVLARILADATLR